MKYLLVLPACLGLLAAGANAQIRVDAVVNAASYAQPGMPNAGIAQGSFASAFGAGLGRLKTSDEITLPLQTDWGGLTVRVTVGGTTVNAWPVYSNGSQVNFIIPSGTPVGTGTVTISYNGQSASAPVTIVPRSFGVFAINSAGSGPGIFTDANDRPILLNNSARPGQILNLWGTGIGPVAGNEAAGPLPGNMPAAPVEVWIGDRQATVSYKGRSGCCIGVDQIQVTIPDGITGCYVPVTVVMGDVISNSTTISIAPTGGTCSDPTGLTPELISAAAGGGAVRIGSVLLTRTGIKASVPGVGEFTSNTDSGSGSFYRYDFTKLISSSTGVGVAPFGSCTVYTYQGEAGIPTDITQPVPLDAGASLQLTGPKGAKTLAKQSAGNYSAQLGGGISGLPGGIPGLPGAQEPYLDAGSYTVRGTGGGDVGAFSATLTLGTPLNWTNMDAITAVTRSSGVTVNWTGGEGYVIISGSSGITSPRSLGATFACFQRATAGTFTVPPRVLLALPATPAGSQTGGILFVGNSTTPVPFTASGLDQGTFAAATTFLKNVNYR